MGYIGSQPATNFETVRKQVSTTNSGTTITLDYSVSSVQDILVTVNAVVQSYDNYTVSGTTLTLGGTLNNDRVEILYVGRTFQTVTPDTGTVTNDMLAGSIDLTSKVTGVLPIANGGTNVSSGFSYSIGTFTPTMSGITLNFTTGNYVKIGSAVSIQGYIDMGTQSGATTCVISGLPFTSANYTQYLDATGDYLTGTSQALRIPASASTMSLISKTNHSDNNNSDFNYNDMNGKYFYFHGVYYV